MNKGPRDILCVAVALLALSVGAANKIRIGPPPDVKPHLDQVRLAAAQVGGEVAGMIVKHGQVPRQAFDMLRPNVLETRMYTDLASGLSYSVLLVHCGDISDMGAHYPPACYPGSGLKVTATTPMPLDLRGRSLNGVEYELKPSRIDERAPIRIWNCMFLPGGASTYEPQTLRRYVRRTGLRYYGAGQIQVLVPASLDESQRVTIYEQVLNLYAPAIDVMLSDPQASPSSRATELKQ